MHSNTDRLKQVNWDNWLEHQEVALKAAGYRKHLQHHKSEDFAYWKKFDGYQVGVLFYDFRKYADRDPAANRISTAYECMILGDERIDMSVSMNIKYWHFEEMAAKFYEAMKTFQTNKNE
jgi:hypothetical protein